MKKVFIPLFVFILCLQNMNIFAQEEDPRERIKAMKVAYVTERIELTAGEAEKFWPVYNEYEKRKIDILHEIRGLRKYYDDHQESIKDEELVKLLDKFIKLQQEDAELLTSYHKKFLEILPPDKVMKLYIAEVQFKNYLLKRLREHREEGPGRHGPPA